MSTLFYSIDLMGMGVTITYVLPLFCFFYYKKRSDNIRNNDDDDGDDQTHRPKWHSSTATTSTTNIFVQISITFPSFSTIVCSLS